MSSSSRKLTMQMFDKAINTFTSKKKLVSKKPSAEDETTGLSSTKEPKAIESQEFLDQESEMFDAKDVRLSIVDGDGIDQYSLIDLEASTDFSLFTESEDSTPLFSLEVAVGNSARSTSDDDDDDLYLDEGGASREVCDPEASEESGENSDGEEEGSDTFDMNGDVGFSSDPKPVNLHTATGGVTESVIAYTTRDPVAVSINQIDKMMEVGDSVAIRDPDEPPDVEHEDNSVMLTQFRRAISGGPLAVSINRIDKMMELRESVAIRDPDEPPDVEHEDSSVMLTQFRRALSIDDAATDAQKQGELESEFEMEMHETDKWAHELVANKTSKALVQEKPKTLKAKTRQIEQAGEQVHMARGFALQSVKAVRNSTKVKTYYRGGTASPTVIQCEVPMRSTPKKSGLAQFFLDLALESETSA